MEELLPYYERELAFLRGYSHSFAERYPKIARRLLLTGDVGEDPHADRMVESFALLGARVSKKVEDGYPEFIEALLEVLYPHYLRPFPSCSIARFDIGHATEPAAGFTVPRGAELVSRAVRGVPCRFRTCYDVVSSPLRMVSARFHPVAQAPRGTRLPAQSGGHLALQFEWLAERSSPAESGPEKLRIFTDGEPSFCAALRDVLALKIAKSYVEAGRSGLWMELAGNPFRPVGMADDEALIDYPARAHPAYRLLTEFFAFPDKFGFFDIDLRQAAAIGGRRFALHLVFKDLPADSVQARLLEALTENNLLAGCTPVVNLFRTRAEPIRVSHTAVSYPVVADTGHAYAYEVFSIDAVARIQKTEQGESVTEFRPFYALRHGEQPERKEQYWIAHRNDQVARLSPGFEMELSLVDADFDPMAPRTDVLSLDLTCSNRDLPEQLAYGVQGGDLLLKDGQAAGGISLLRKPTPAYRYERGRGMQWRLVSHLASDHLSLVDGGLAPLKETLRLYDLPNSAISTRHIDGIVDIERRPATAWLPGRHFASTVRGTEIRLTLDEESFVGSGIHVFASVLDRFFGLYVQANSFTQLVLLSKRSGEELLRCPPRNGDSVLA